MSPTKPLGFIADVFKNLWFRDPGEDKLFINDTAVRIRAGILLSIPLYLGFTLFDAEYGSRWVVTENIITDTLETDFDGRILYSVEAVRRTFDFSVQTWVLLYALFDMLSGMFAVTSRLSPSILISSFLAKSSAPVWKPLLPKRFAWSIGAILIMVCLVYFNPEIFAGWVNTLFFGEILATTHNYMPRWVPWVLVWVCIGFMWMETVLGVCAGCKVHTLLVRMGLLDEACEACNNLNVEAESPPAR